MLNEKVKKVFENIDSKIFESEDVQNKLSEVFDSAVDESADAKAKTLVEAKEVEFGKTLDEMINTVKKTIEMDNKEKFDEAVEAKVKKISEAKEVELTESAEKQITEAIDEMHTNNKKYIEHAVQSFVDEAMPKWQQEKEVLEAKKIVDEFTVLSEAFGVKVSKLDESDVLVKTNKALDEAIDKNKELEKSIIESRCDILLKEAHAGLTSPQADKLTALMEEVEKVNEDSYKTKLDFFKSALDEKNSPKKVSSNSSSASWK